MQPNGPHWQAPPQQQQYAQPQQQQQMGYYGNPYAAPAMYREDGFVPFGATSGPLPNPVLKKIKLALAIAQLVGIFGGFGMLLGGSIGEVPALAVVGSLLLGLGYLFVFATLGLTIYWNYTFWSWVPPEQRWTNMWRKYISPGMLIGFMFIPYFNIYWMFVTYLGIADILERMRVQYPSNARPLKNQAIFTLVGGILFFPAAPLLQYFFQKNVEEMATEMSRSMPRPMV